MSTLDPAPWTGARRVALIGTGLIGGSIGRWLVERGVTVVGQDHFSERAERARELGAVTEVAATLEDAVAGADLVVVAAPVGHIAKLVVRALDAGAPVVTDVGSVKASVVEAVERARPGLAGRFVGGHPMAGSELEGVDGARPDLFVGAVWVLTPTQHTAPETYSRVHELVSALGAEAVGVPPQAHDTAVSYVSHLPQLASSALMAVAAAHDDEDRSLLLRLAAGGFRDMTRIAAGNPSIWPDILAANRDAVIEALDAYLALLADVRTMLAVADGDAIHTLLSRARQARRNLPLGAAAFDELVELSVPVPDRPGVLAEVTTLASRLGVNIFDIAISHSVEGASRGVLQLVVPAASVHQLADALHALGYATTRRELEGE